MQKKYPEHIAEIENFYQDKLEGIKIEPPAAMWDRINSAMEKDRKPKGGFISTKKIIAISTLFLIAIAITYTLHLSTTNNSDSPESPLEIKNFPATGDTTDSPVNNSDSPELSKKETQEEQENISEAKANLKKFSNKEPDKSEDSKKVTLPSAEADKTPVADTLSEKTPSTNSVVQEETKENQLKKEKQSFKDKYKKKYQDSTRPLFVPDK